jgi:DNA-binding PadR family transcriptional regulator/polyisoprenoid-binding protein YceI
MLPAILLLLSERPSYGYALVPRLRDLRFGRVDRPAVYRALGQLEQDSLVHVSAEHTHSGQTRRVYSVTPLGERVLRVWMGVIREEHAHLGEVIHRYQATGTTDAVLAEVESGWLPELDMEWSSVSTTSRWRRRLLPLETDEAAEPGAPDPAEAGPPPPPETTPATPAAPGRRAAAPSHPHEPVMRRFSLDPERSAVIVEARSTVGPISFGTIGIEGCLYAVLEEGVVSTDVPPTGWLTIDVSGLRSGNKLYDAELQRRIDARRFPTATVEVKQCSRSIPGPRYQLRGELTFHGITREAEGTVTVEALTDDRLVISGEQVFDIRDFEVPSPTMLMLRIFPDVRVRLQAEAGRVDD